MSGVMYWYGDCTGYAVETDPGTVKDVHGGTNTDPTEYSSGSAQEWGWHPGWGEENSPLELPGFAVEVTSGGSYVVTLMPAEGPVKNLNTGVTYGTIQLAIDDASPGDTIEASAGTYDELITINKALTLQGSGYSDTIIDRWASTAGETVVTIKDIPSGDVTFTGFKIINGSGELGDAYAMTVTNCDGSSVITISDNYIQGSNAGGDYGDWGLIAGYGNQAKVVVTGNTFNNTYNNEILFEQQVGATEVSYNTFGGAFPTVYYMSHGGVDVTTPQVVKNNIFEMEDADPHGVGLQFPL